MDTKNEDIGLIIKHYKHSIKGLNTWRKDMYKLITIMSAILIFLSSFSGFANTWYIFTPIIIASYSLVYFYCRKQINVFKWSIKNPKLSELFTTPQISEEDYTLSHKKRKKRIIISSIIFLIFPGLFFIWGLYLSGGVLVISIIVLSGKIYFTETERYKEYQKILKETKNE